MNPKQYNRWLSRAVNAVGDNGWKVASIKIDQAIWNGKGGLNFALYIVNTSNSFEKVTLSVSCDKKRCVINEFFPEV